MRCVFIGFTLPLFATGNENEAVVAQTFLVMAMPESGERREVARHRLPGLTIEHRLSLSVDRPSLYLG